MASDVPTGTLISFDDDDSLNKPSINEPKDVKEKPKEDDISTKESSKSKLCGYLDKLGAKGLIRAFKTRWFIYEPRRCQLYYYRTPQDLAPLGSIDIANATFTFDLNNTEKMGQFNIVTKNRVYQLQAKDNATMMYWLQELQERRRDYSRIRTCQSRDSNVASVSKPTSGLMKPSQNENTLTLSDLPPILSPVDIPDDTIGQKSANSPHHSAVFNFSLTNWKTELRNQFRSKVSGHQDTATPPRPQSQFYDIDELEDLVVLEEEKNKLKTQREGIASTIKKKLSLPRPLNDPEPSQIQLSLLREELDDVETEMKACKEVITLLHNQLAATQLEKASCDDYLKCKSDKERVSLLQRKDKQLIQLQQILDEFRSERDNLQEQIRYCKTEIVSLKEQCTMYTDMLQAKDEIIVSLTNQIFDLDKNAGEEGRSSGHIPMNSSTNTVVKTVENAQELEKLKDACQAFRTQNQFLNKEILELNLLRDNDRKRERTQMDKYSTIEAELCRIQSKYYLLLQESKSAKREEASGPTDEMVIRLLEEATSTEETIQRAPGRFSRHDDYDRYGFCMKLQADDEDSFISKATDLQRRSEELTMRMVDLEMSVGIKWENYIVNQQNRQFCRSPELKALIRAGIPNEYREQIWKGCINFRVGVNRANHGDDYYRGLLESKLFKLNPSTKQIELDLLRTLPNNKHYETMDSEGIPKLRRVLLAYSCHNPDIGYCQGLNRIAAIALLFLSEEDAFWCIVAIVEYLQPCDYYSKTLIGSQTDQRVCKDLISDKLPRLSAHFDKYNADLSLITFNWFLTIFCDGVPTETMLRVWDSFLYEGNKVLFRFALAFFKQCEEEILQLTDYLSLFKHLRHMSMKMTDVQKITQFAFHDINPFPMKIIKTRRAFHLAQVKAQLEEIDAIREDFISHRQHREDDVFSDEDN